MTIRENQQGKFSNSVFGSAVRVNVSPKWWKCGSYMRLASMLLYMMPHQAVKVADYCVWIKS